MPELPDGRAGPRAGRHRLQRGAEQHQAERQAGDTSPPQLHVGSAGSALPADGRSCDRPGAEERGEPGTACGSFGASLPPRGSRKPPPRPARTTGSQKPTPAEVPHSPTAGRGARGGQGWTAAVAEARRAGNWGDLQEVSPPGEHGDLEHLIGGSLVAGRAAFTAPADPRWPRSFRWDTVPRSAGGAQRACSFGPWGSQQGVTALQSGWDLWLKILPLCPLPPEPTVALAVRSFGVSAGAQPCPEQPAPRCRAGVWSLFRKEGF